MVLFKLLERGLGLVSTLILARLLLPQDFGIVAMATSIVALLEIFSSFGMDTVLIQRRDADRGHFDTAWTLNVLAGCAVAAVIALLAVPASRFYREPRLIAVMCVLALTSVVGACENIGVVEFRRQLRFDREFHYLLAKKLFAFAVTVPLALWLHSYWALIVGTFVGRLGGLLYSYLIQPLRPRFSLGAAPEMLHFSKWLMIQNGLTFLRDRAATFFIGRLAGSAALGSFAVSTEIANMPGTELIAPINRALLPAYARLADEPEALRAEFLASMSGIALLGVPAVAGVALAAPSIVLLVLGPTWSAAQRLLEVLAFFGISQVLQSNSYAALIALGKPGLFARVNALQVGLLLAALLVLTPSWGALGAAWAYVIAALGALPVNLLYLTRQLSVTGRELLTAVWRPLVSAAAMYGGGRLWGPVLPATATTSAAAFAPFAQCVIFGASVYVAIDASLWLAAGRPRGAETWILRQLRVLLGRR